MHPGSLRGSSLAYDEYASLLAPAMRRSEAGFSLVAVAASIAIMAILMGMAVPTWKYVMQDAREEELIFRGTQIVEAIERYQKKHGNAPPTSVEMLVKGKFLRKAYKDPMTEKGLWKFIRPGEGIALPGSVGGQRGRPSPSPTPSRGSSFGRNPREGESMGPFMGVASTSQEKSLRVFNGRTRYDQWLFVVGQPRIVGKDANMRVIPGVRRPQRDNPSPVR
jgi:type II secretory pathway pseudopilin PulG